MTSSSRRSMDRMAPSEGADAGSIPAESNCKVSGSTSSDMLE